MYVTEVPHSECIFPQLTVPYSRHIKGLNTHSLGGTLLCLKVIYHSTLAILQLKSLFALNHPQGATVRLNRLISRSDSDDCNQSQVEESGERTEPEVAPRQSGEYYGSLDDYSSPEDIFYM